MAAAQRLAAAGANILAVARRQERLEELQRQLTAQYDVTVDIHVLDVRDRTAVETFFASWFAGGHHLDILLNNAGLAMGKAPVQEGDWQDWDEMIDTNVKGLLYVSRSVLPHMVSRNSGHVVNIGSIAGHWVYPGGNVYNASKFAVRALGEGMNMDLLGTNIRVSNVDPGACETEFSLVRFHGDQEAADAVYKGFEPLRPEDVADAICYVLQAPPHVNVANLVLMATAQRGATLFAKEKPQTS